MEFIQVDESNKDEYNQVVSHPLQSFEWGEFREKTGVKVIRRALVKNGEIIDGFTLTVHKIPRLPYTIGYLPKGNKPNEQIISELKKIGKENNCIFIQLEPNLVGQLNLSDLKPAAHPLFTKYSFVLDISKTEEELLKNMHPKTRYNIKVAQKHNIEIVEDNSKESFEEYLKLTKETTKRQAFYAHTPFYHKTLFETLSKKSDSNSLSYHLLKAVYRPDKNPVNLTSWVLFVFHDALYYPYGASNRLHRETMASNLMAWEAIKFGKKLGLKTFDMWGALGQDPDKNDPWYGFHRFKEGYGGNLVEFVGSYDLIINPALYKGYKMADKLRWFYLRARKII